jgi:hypothetical protein
MELLYSLEEIGLEDVVRRKGFSLTLGFNLITVDLDLFIVILY